MLRNFVNKQNLPILAGLTVGGLAALYFTRSASTLRADAPASGLNPNEFVPLPLASSRYVSKDTKELVFSLPEGETIGAQTAFMVMFKRVSDSGKSNIIRPYTPVSPPSTKGHATFVIKAYPGGKMSEYLHGLKPGDTVDIKGPLQKYLWEANKHNKIALIGGGTGITPLFQLLETVANDPKDKTQVELYYGSNTPEDVLLGKEIDELVAKKPEQLKVHYFATKPDANWKGETGFVSEDYLKSHIFKASEDNVKVFVCGPPPLYDAISGNKVSPSDQGELKGALKNLGFTKEQVFKF